MRVNFLGLVGPLGVLPIYYTELVANRLQARDYTLRDFLDIFHHRLISLFYRAWQKYRYMVPYEQGEGDQFSQYLLDIAGLGTPGLQNRQTVTDISLLYYTGLIAQQPRSASALEQIIADYFRMPVQVEQFLGAWYRLSEDAQCNLDDDGIRLPAGRVRCCRRRRDLGSAGESSAGAWAVGACGNIWIFCRPARHTPTPNIGDASLPGTNWTSKCN